MTGKNLRGKRPVKLSFGVSWLYVILFIGIGWMFFNQGWANPQKEEWADVTKQWLDGDIKEVTFVRNEYEGMVTIKPDRLEKYVSAFGGNVPKKSPHFVFLVSGHFNAEEMFGELNAQLPEGEQVKVVIENHESLWGMLQWLVFPALLLFMWFFMFRGMNRNLGGGAPGGPGGIFSVGKSTGKLAEKDSMKVPVKVWLEDPAQLEESCKKQAYRLSTLPFLHKWVCLMPDTHTGKGMPIGGVIAAKDVIIPNAVGVDIGCGMDFVSTNIRVEDIRKIREYNFITFKRRVMYG